MGGVVTRADSSAIIVAQSQGFVAIKQVLLRRAGAGVAMLVEGVGIVRVEPGRLIEVLNGAVGLALVGIGDAAVVESPSIVWVEPDRLGRRLLSTFWRE